jgi:GNAT superfamily N-acetyltransferase
MLVRLAELADRASVIEAVVAAFERDPAFRFFFPDDRLYLSQASAFVGCLFDKRLEHGTVWVAEDGAGAALWSPPDQLMTAESMARAKALTAVMERRIGPEASARLAAYDAVVEQGLPPQPFWYLGVLAVHPGQSGRGVGSALIEAGLTHVRARNAMAILETTNPRNLTYYRRRNWELIKAVESSTPSTVWIFRAT